MDTTPGDAAPSGTSTVPQKPGVADEMQVGMQGACNLRSLPPQEYPQAPVMDFSQLAGAHIQAPQPGLLNDMSRIDNLSAPVGMYVPQSVKEKIWQGKFVDFENLLPQNRAIVEAEEWIQACVSPANDSGIIPPAFPAQFLGASLHSLPGVGPQENRQTKKRQITSIGEWTDAMLIFMNIYILKHPNQVHQLLKYCTTVREAAARFGNRGALDYDKAFRMKRAMDPSRRWDALDNESYFFLLVPQALAGRLNSNTAGRQGQDGQPFRRNAKSAPMPKGVCWAFNRGNCNKTNCVHPHKCATCKKNHPQTDRKSVV